MSLGIKKGDRVIVLAGKDKGKVGRVVNVYPAKDRLLVEGINMVKRHMRKSQQHPSGAIIHKELPIHLSNVALICPTSQKATRFSVTTAADGSKQRLSSNNKVVID